MEVCIVKALKIMSSIENSSSSSPEKSYLQIKDNLSVKENQYDEGTKFILLCAWKNYMYVYFFWGASSSKDNYR